LSNSSFIISRVKIGCSKHKGSNITIRDRSIIHFLEGYKQRHGTYPDKLTFNLWEVETIRLEGVMESQIMYLMGIKPKWDERGRVINGLLTCPLYYL
jgi:cobalamin biosynthesis Mg chelatase CobN